MSNEGNFHENEEIGDCNCKEIISYKKEKNKNYIKQIRLYACGVLAVFLIGVLGAKVYVDNYKKEEVADKSNEKNIENAIQTIQRSLVSISNDESKLINNSYSDGNLSGVVLEENGTIVTTYSLIKDFDEIYIKPSSAASKPMKSELIFFNKEIDMAILKLENITLEPAKIADFNRIKEGKFVLSVGNAIGSEYVGLVTMGIINSTSQMVDCNFTGEQYRVIQVDSKFSEGNYGGAVININGELIGVASKYLTDIYGNGYYAVVDIETIKSVVEKMVNELDRMGMTGSFMKSDDIKDGQYVYILNVKKDGPAHRADIRPTDIITKINGNEITSQSVAYDMMIKYGKDKVVNLTILRDNKEINKKIIFE